MPRRSFDGPLTQSKLINLTHKAAQITWKYQVYMSFCLSNVTEFTYEEETNRKIPVLVDNQFIESVFGKTMFSDLYFKLDIILRG